MTEQSAKSLEISAKHFGITLRQFSLGDAADIFQLIDRNRAHLSQPGDNTADKYQTIESVEESIRNPQNPGRLRFGVWNNNNQIVGSINLTPDEDNPKKGEVGYYLGSEFTGNGYMTNALLTLSTYALNQLGLKELYAKVNPQNSASPKVLLRAGFTETGTMDGDRLFTLVKPKS